MADFRAWFIDGQGSLPQMSRATLALGIEQGFLFVLLICLFYCCWEQAREREARGFKIQQGIAERVRGWWGWKVFDCQAEGPKEMQTSCPGWCDSVD